MSRGSPVLVTWLTERFSFLFFIITSQTIELIRTTSTRVTDRRQPTDRLSPTTSHPPLYQRLDSTRADDEDDVSTASRWDRHSDVIVRSTPDAIVEWVPDERIRLGGGDHLKASPPGRRKDIWLSRSHTGASLSLTRRIQEDTDGWTRSPTTIHHQTWFEATTLRSPPLPIDLRFLLYMYVGDCYSAVNVFEILRLYVCLLSFLMIPDVYILIMIWCRFQRDTSTVHV